MENENWKNDKNFLLSLKDDAEEMSTYYQLKEISKKLLFNSIIITDILDVVKKIETYIKDKHGIEL